MTHSHSRRPKEQHTPRGTLKIYLGAAPGVGKTVAMLNEAHELVKRGRDVVVGLVEDHDREFTKQRTAGLEVLKRVKGVGKGELDVQAVLDRNPEIVLVDEFAHSNPTGSKNPKRWGDVNDILAAGIDVISTVNIQHVESLNDVVGRITGITQKETVPDAVVRAADTIELVDLSPEFLRTRLSDGLIYRPERIGPALGGYFRLGNLTALRELALLWLADQVEDALELYREQQSITDTWETRERVVVAVEREQAAEPLIRRGRRVASKSSAELIVVHVVTGDAFLSSSASFLRRLRELSQDMGAKLHQITGDSVPDSLLEFARSVNATQLVLGTSPRHRYARIIEESVTETVLRRSGPIDCHIVNLPPKTSAKLSQRIANFLRIPGKSPSWFHRVMAWLTAVALPALSTFILIGVDTQTRETGTVGAFYFAVILVVSLIAGIWPAILSALLSAMAMNWFFTDPLHTFDIAQPANLVVLIVMVATALAVAMLVQRAKVARVKARQATREADLLAIFSRTALRMNSPQSLVEKTREVFSAVDITVESAEGVPLVSAVNPHAVEFAGTSPETPPADNGNTDTSSCHETIVESTDGSIRMNVRTRHPLAQDRTIIAVIADHIAGLYHQQELIAEAGRAEAVAAADDLRRALLASVSHDLRTPLATAKLSVSSLRSTEVTFSPEQKNELMEGLEESIEQLNVLVANLLDSSRLASGVVEARKDTVEVGETVHRAVASCSFGKPPGTLKRVQVGRSLDGAQCIGDAPLLERALANIIDNALRYSQGSDVVIEAVHNGHDLSISIADSGPGIPEDFRTKIFKPFQRLGDSDNDNGVGLGMSVAKGFIAAMHGSIDVASGSNGGTTVVVTMPADRSAIHVGDDQ